MKSKIAVLVFAVLFILSTIGAAYADSIKGSGLGKGALDSLYCALTGCTMTGAITDLTSAGTVALGGTSIAINSDAGGVELTVDDSSIAILANTVTFERTTSGNNLLMVTNSSDAHASGVRMVTDSAGAASTAGTLGIRRNSTTDTSQLHLTMDTISGIEGITVFRTGPTRIRGVDVPSAFCDSSTADDEDENGAMWYMQTDDGSALCVCMYDGSAYEVKATLTLGTFDDDDCQL